MHYSKNSTPDFANGNLKPRGSVRQRVAELIELADSDSLDLARSRTIEQEVLDMLDEPASR